MTYLNHDHRKRENIRFSAVCSHLIQNLWRSPSRGLILIVRGASYGIQVLGDHGKAEIRDPRMARGIHKDIWLDTCQ